MKVVLFAHIEREIEFDSKENLDKYLDGLKDRKKKFIIITIKEHCGKHTLRFKEQYNKVPFFPEDMNSVKPQG